MFRRSFILSLPASGGPLDSPRTPSQGVPEEVVRRFIRECVQGGRLDLARTLLHPGYVCHEGGETVTREEWLTSYREFLRRHPDLTVAMLDVLPSGDFVAWRWRMEARDLSVHGINIERVRSGRIAETWTVAAPLQPAGTV